MAEPDSLATKAEQRAHLVAKLRRAASLPRMKDGRRPPMHNDAVSESEKGPAGTSTPSTDGEAPNNEQVLSLPDQVQQQVVAFSPEPPEQQTPKDDDESLLPETQPGGFDTEQDGDVEDRSLSPNPGRTRRRPRSRSRSRTSKDFKAKNRAPTPAQASDSSPDEAPPIPLALSIFPALLQPVPSHISPQFTAFQPHPMFAASPDQLFYPGTSPSTPLPLPTLEAIQRGLMRSNSAGAAQASRRLAMAKLTGGTDTYDPSPSPTPPPMPGTRLARNNTVAGGERIAARTNMLGRLANRVAKETDTDQASGEDRGAPSPSPQKRNRRRSRRASKATAPNPSISDSDPMSTPSHTPLVPPTPSRTPLDHYHDIRSESATPNQASSSRNQSNEHVATIPPPMPEVTEPERQEHRRRSVLIEDDEDEDQSQPRITTLSHTPPPPAMSPHLALLRSAMQRSESPTSANQSMPLPHHMSSASGSAVPMYLGRGSPARHDRFPTSPFATPLKEKDRQLSDDDEERVLYPAEALRPRTPATNVDAFDREISWVATPVPEFRMPVRDDEDGETEGAGGEYEEDVVAEVVVKDERTDFREYDEPPVSPTSYHGYSQAEVYDDVSPRVSSTKSIVIESEASADVYPLRFNSPAIPVSQSESYGQRHLERSPLNSEFLEWEDRSATNELTTKRSVEASSPSTWEKMKNFTFSRSASSAGRRSRTNSLANRGDPRNSSISRESQGSLTSGGKGEKMSDLFTQQVAAPGLMPSSSASASMLSLPQNPPFRGNPSPIPPLASADMSKYQNDKLFPFPGMKRLEEQRNRDRARVFPAASASTPDVTQLIGAMDIEQTPPSAPSFSPSPQQSQESSRERKGSDLQQADSRVGFRLGQDSPVRQQGYIDLPPLSASTSPPSSKGKLPVTFTEVKQWLSKNKGKKAQSQQRSPTPTSSHLPPQIEQQSSTSSTKIPSLSELLKTKDMEINSDWEDSRTPTNTNGAHSMTTSPSHKAFSSFGYRSGRETPATGVPTDTERTPKAKKVLPLTLTPSGGSGYVVVDDQPTPELAKPDRYMSPTPDPTSSVSEAPQSTSESGSAASSHDSLGPTPQAQMLMERLEDTLSRGAAPLDEPPRKLIVSGAVLQVVNSNTVKDRFLFLFTDILVVTKPIFQGGDDSFSNPTDKKYIIKSVVRFRDLRFCQDRTEPTVKTVVPSSIPETRALRHFIASFAHNPESAIAELEARINRQLDPSTLAQVLFKTVELDRQRLGDYLAQRTSKNVLRAFLDNFGFTAIRIDIALRIFLQSIHVDNVAQSQALEYVQETFANRWYEANAKIVAFDRDMALRLVLITVQLNQLLHGSISDEIGPPGQTAEDNTSPFDRSLDLMYNKFYDAFRRYDPRRLVSDEYLGEIYDAIRKERLVQARSPAAAASSPDVSISFMKPLPVRLTYRVQSDLIIVRLPQPDPDLTLHLHGHDLVFEPPVLNFSRSPEASFRITGTSLGAKTLVIRRSGPNAIKYAGLPLSYNIPVERAFMRNTFQVAFLNHEGTKRRYMFSVDDHLERHQWVTSIRQQIEKSLATTSTPGEHMAPGATDFYRAAEEVSFKVLQETLIQSVGQSLSAAPTRHRQNSQAHGHTRTAVHTPSAQSPTAVGEKDPNGHRRSKSRSKLYPRQGPSRLDFDLSTNSHRYDSSRESNETDESSNGVPSNMGGPYENGSSGSRIWSGRELQLHCLQNSLIPSVLSYLQGVKPIKF